MTQAELAPTGAAAVKPGLSHRALMQTLGMLPVLILLCAGFWALNPRFASVANLSIVLQQASINIVLASGMTFVILTAGIDLSVGSVLAAAAMVSVWASLDPNLAALAVPLGLLAGLGLGLVNGALIARVNLSPFIVTLGMLTAVRGLARLIGNDRTLLNPDLGFAWIGNGIVLGVPVLVILAALVVVASWFLLRKTIFGQQVYCVGGNEAAARLAGIPVARVLMAVYGISGLLAGLGGVMSSARLYSANGLQLGQAYELDAIAAVILGGTSFVGGVGSIWGTLVGALIISVLSNGLILVGVPDIWQYIIKGLVIVGAVAIDKLRSR
jgi:ribose transport system permease protein